MAIASYRTLRAVEHDNTRYAEGELIALDDVFSAALLAVNAIELESVVADNSSQIQAAMRQLDTADATLWLKDGRPKTEAVSAVAGFAVSAAERDAAWAVVSAA